MAHYVKSGRHAYKAIMAPTFLDKNTGAFEQINESPWFLKVRKGTPSYFLKMDDKFQQMPEACFRATAARSATFNLAGVEDQIENFCKKKYRTHGGYSMRLARTDDYNQFCQMVGANIRFCRIAKELTQTKVSLAIDVTFQQMQKYESGSNCLNTYRLVQLANFFKVGVQDLVNPDFIANNCNKKLSRTPQDAGYLQPQVMVGSLEEIKDKLKKDGIDPEETILPTLRDKAGKLKSLKRMQKNILGDLTFDASKYEEFEEEYPAPLSQLEHDPKMRATYDAIIDGRKRRH